MVVDVGEIRKHIKPKADSTLRNMRKDDLINYVRILEHNYDVAQTFLDQQAKNFENYAPVRRDPCEFCARFDFGGVKTQIDKYGARIVVAVACSEYPVHEQFNFCPVCGRSRKEGAEDAEQ